jgi:hypothetical protein
MRRRLLVGLVVLVLGGALLPMGQATAATPSQEVAYRRITFPVQGAVGYANTWLAPRAGGRSHHGADLMGHKLQVLVAAHDGTVSWTRTNGSNMLSIRDSEGWEYWYIHINNDSPGTDDGANPPEHMFFPGIQQGVKVTAGQPIAYMGDSGDAETTQAHLHFEIHQPGDVVINPYWSLMLSQGRRVQDRCGFDLNPLRSAPASGSSFWTLTRDGGVYSFGGAPFSGSMAGKPLNAPIIGLTPLVDGAGYWQLAADGGIFSFGGASFHGSTGNLRLNQPIVGMASTPTGKGYWLLAADGGTFNFGDAPFLGSGVGRTHTPMVDIAVTPTGKGFWMVSRGGGVFTFGDAAFHGAVDWIGFCDVPATVALAPSPTGRGYWLQAADGNTFAFGDAPDLGSVKRAGVPAQPSVDLAAP